MTNLNRNNSTSRYIDGLIVQDLMYSILHKAKKKKYIVHFNENKMYSWPVRNHQVYTVKYSSCLTLISHTHQVLSDVIISHIFPLPIHSCHDDGPASAWAFNPYCEREEETDQ